MYSRRGLFDLLLIVVVVVVVSAKPGWPAAGTEGASFLDIPVGGAPAALGSAYTAQANDVYAPVWNPTDLGFLHSFEFTDMHLNYLEPVHYEHTGFVIPFGKDDENSSSQTGFGTSIQYLNTDSIDSRDE